MRFTEVLENGSTKQIEQIVGHRLSKNARFFQSHSPHIYALLTRQPSVYQLLINDEGLNIYQLQNKQFIFPYEENRHRMVEVSKQIAQSPLHNSKWSVTTNNVRLNYMDETRFPQTGKIVGDMMDYVMKEEPMDTLSMHLPSRFLPTTTIFGLAGGLFLEYLLDEYEKIHTLLIFDEYYDFFRISCCFVDYEELFARVSPKSCYLFIEDIVDRKLIKRFYQEHRVTSNFVRLELELYESDKTQEIKEIATAEQNANTRGWGTYEDEMIGVRNHQQNIDLAKPKLDIPVLNNPRKVNLPICVVGNGPSLDNLIPFIRENQEKMILFSSGTALRRLMQEGIKPDFQIEIERLDYLPDVLKEAGLEDVPVIGGNMVNPGVYAIAQEEYIFLRGSSAVSYANDARCVVEYAYPFVGNAAVALAMQFSETVLMCGLDTGYKKGQSKHARGSMYENDPKWAESEYTLPKDAVPTKGNLSDDIYTDSIFTLSRQMFELAIVHYHPKKVLNLSDGAYIKGTTPAYADDITLEQGGKKAKIKEIKKAFSAEKESVFGRTEPIDLEQLIDSYRDEIFGILSQEIATKEQFFTMIDAATKRVQQIRDKDEHIGILMQGSMLHVLNAMFLIMIYTKTNNIAPLHQKLLELFQEGYKQFQSRYSATRILANMPKIS